MNKFLNWLGIRVKAFYPTFGFSFVWYSDEEERSCNLVRINFIYGDFWLLVPRILKARIERVIAKSWDAETVQRMGRDWYEKKIKREYGFAFTKSSLHVYWGIQPGFFSSKDKKNSDHVKVFTYPWADWRLVRDEVMLIDGGWANAPRYLMTGKQPDPESMYRKEFPYHYKDSRVEQSTIAEVTVARQEYRIRLLRWLPVGSVTRRIKVDFADELGSERGSWKGGVLGTSHEMLAGETPEQTLQRMQVERKF